MINTNHLCMACMKNKGDSLVCPYCKSQDSTLQSTPYLPPRTWLMDRYLVGKKITHDTEGVVYLGWDNILQSVVYIREFFPDGLCSRTEGQKKVTPLASNDYTACLNAFLDLNRSLGRMRDLAALFPVYDIFEENGTGYVVSEYTESISLSDFLSRNNGSLTFEQTRALMLPSLSTLSALHSAGIIHGGISPDTLFVGKDGKLRIGGFASQSLRFAKGTLKTQLFNGYAAIEQYGFDHGKAGAHTDLYAFAATMYRVLAGVAPMSAKERVNNDTFTMPSVLLEKTPGYAVDALMHALQLMPEQRTQTVDRFRSEFAETPVMKETKNPVPVTDLDEDEIDEEEVAKRKPVFFIAMISTLSFLLVVLFVMEIAWGVPFGIFNHEPNAPSVIVLSEPSTTSLSGELTRKIPNFVNQSFKLTEANYTSYNFKVEYYAYSDQYAKGVIMSQSPAPDTEIPLSSEQTQEIVVTVSLGAQQLTVPQVKGLTYAQALDKLWEAGFLRESISTNTTNPSYSDIVENITPAPGNITNIETADIMLYLKKPEPQYYVPENNNQETSNETNETSSTTSSETSDNTSSTASQQ